MNTFLKLDGVKLNAAGYLVTVDGEKPVNHSAFVQEQNQAEFAIRVAEAIKGKNLKSSKVTRLEDIMAEVHRAMNTTVATSYVAAPTEPVRQLTKQLSDEALAFVDFQDQKAEVAEINRIMQQYNTINAIEKVGDYFSEGLVKMNQTKLYTIAEIQEAVTAIQTATSNK